MEQHAAKDAPRGKLRFESIEEIEEFYRHHRMTDYEVRQLGAGPIQSDWSLAESDGIRLFSARYTNKVSVCAHPSQVALLFCTSDGAPVMASGSDVANKALHFTPKGAATDIVTPMRVGSELIMLSEDRFAEIATVVAPELTLHEHVVSLRGDTAQLHKIRRAVLEITADPQWNPRGEQISDLVATSILWMAAAAKGPTRSTSQRAEVAKRARDYIEAYYPHAVRIEDLCREIGASARTVQRSFRAYFNLTITQYLNTVRLNGAHRGLLESRGPDASVASVATQNGFTHLGRFSVDYKARFGQSPSATLGNGAPSPADRLMAH